VSRADPAIRVVLDTNVLVRAIANPSSQSGQLASACEERRAIALLSKPLIDEYRRVLSRLRDFDEAITSFHIEAILRRLRYFGEYRRLVHSSFHFRRDPTDSKLIELAIDAHATHIISYDADLLTLPESRGEAGKRVQVSTGPYNQSTIQFFSSSFSRTIWPDAESKPTKLLRVGSYTSCWSCTA
jgi:putative PIN family toxin of toxin-antitoxin system